MYITEEDYKSFTGKEPPKEFKSLLNRASAELDVLTRFYYRFHELEDDFRGIQFKRAIIVQIEFYNQMGTTSSEEMNNQPDSVRIGNTTVSYNRTGTGAEQMKRSNSISQDALTMLSGTGLLYRGGGAYRT